MLRSLLLILGLACVTATNVLQLVQCNNASVTLTPMTPVRFESASFPSFPGINKECHTVFKRNDGNNGLWLVFTNGFISEYLIFDGDTTSRTAVSHSAQTLSAYVGGNGNHTGNAALVNSYDSMTNNIAIVDNVSGVFTMYFDSAETDTWGGFQAIAYAPKSPVDPSVCPLTGASMVDFTDNSYQFPVWSKFPKQNATSSMSCSWAFTVPAGYKLRVLTNYYKPATDESLSVTVNQKTYYISEVGVQTFEGTAFEVRINRVATNTPDNIIMAYVSAEAPVVPMEQCSVTSSDDGSMMISNYNPTKGYANGETCTKSLGINNGIIMAYLLRSHIDIGDQIQLANSNGAIKLRQASEYWQFDKEGGETKFSFKADGAIVQAGYQLHIWKPQCSCPKDFALTCNTTLDRGLLENDMLTYCPGMNCEFAIRANPACPEKWVRMRTYVSLREASSDVFKVLVDGQSQVSVNSATPQRDINLFKPTSTIQVQFSSGPAQLKAYRAPTVRFTLSSVDPPKTNTYTLDQINFSKSVNMYGFAANQLITVQAPVGKILDLYVVTDPKSAPSLSDYELFNGGSMVNYKGNLDGLPVNKNGIIPRMFATNEGAITVHTLAQNYINLVLFFRIRDYHAAGCVSYQNVLQTEKYDTAEIITTRVATAPCMTTIVAYGTATPNVQIQSIFFDSIMSNDAKVKVLESTHANFPYLTYTPKNAVKWGSVTLGGPVTSLLFDQPGNYSFAVKNVAKLNFPVTKSERGVIFTNSFYGTYSTSADEFAMGSLSVSANSAVAVTCTFFDVAAGGTVRLQSSGAAVDVTKIGQSFNFTSSVTLKYKYGNMQERGAVFEYQSLSGDDGVNPTGTPGAAAGVGVSLFGLALVALLRF